MAARTLIASTQSRPSGTVQAFTAGDVANGMKFVPGQRIYLQCVNSDGGSAHTVTLVLPPPPDIADATDRTISVPANNTRIVGPFPGDTYTQPTAADPLDVGFVHVNVDSTQISLAAVRL